MTLRRSMTFTMTIPPRPAWLNGARRSIKNTSLDISWTMQICKCFVLLDEGHRHRDRPQLYSWLQVEPKT
jgi:hypothetical protein